MIRQYNIPFEEEVMPLFIGGVSVVGLIALVIGCLLLYRNRHALCLFLGHMASMAAAMVFLIRCLFGGRLGIVVPDFHASEFQSLNLGFFGVFWAFSMMFLVLMMLTLRKNGASLSENRTK